MSAAESMVKTALEYQRNPLAFVVDVIHAKPTREQRAMLESLGRPGARIAVRSGHGIGKSSCLAWTILWGVSVFDDVKVPCTATKRDQLRDVLWSELAKWKGQMATAFAKRLVLNTERLCIYGHEETRFAVPRTARPENPDALQGFHAKNLLFVLDEASGIQNKIFEAAEGALSTANSRWIMVGNPTRSEGFFFDAFHKDRQHWQTFHFSSKDSELADPAYSQRMLAKYGANSPVYIVRVLGDFPPASADVLIQLDWLEAADDRDCLSPQSPVVGGLDVARYGDDMSAIVLRRGSEIIYAEQWAGHDLMYSCGRVVKCHAEQRVNFWRVDSIGMGAGVVDRLRELDIPTAEINVSESPADNEKFAKLRDELWWRARDFYYNKNSRIDPKLPLKDDLIAQLSTVRYGLTSTGKIKVEGKDEMKARGVDSPNLADAHNLTFAEGFTATTRSQQSAPVTVTAESDYVW